MPNKTTNLGYELPLGNETADIDVLNSNFTKIDSDIKAIKDNMSKPSLFVQGTDPASGSNTTIKTSDVWMDTTNFICKIRMSDGTWKPQGAVYL